MLTEENRVLQCICQDKAINRTLTVMKTQVFDFNNG